MSAKTLVAYFSASGTTKRIAEAVAKAANADLFEIKPRELYTPADLNWQDKQSRSSLEMSDPTSRPALDHDLVNVADYEAVILGFPIWWYTAPHIIESFLEGHDFARKTMIVFCTSGSSGLGDTIPTLQRSVSFDTRWRPGMRFAANATDEEIGAWVATLGLPEA